MATQMTGGFLRDVATNALAVRFAGPATPVFGGSIGTPVTAASSEVTTVARSGVTVPAGALVVVGVSWYGSGITATLADNGPGLAWTLIRQRSGVADSSRHIAQFAAVAPAGLDAATLTATFSSAAFGRAIFGGYFTGAAATTAATAAGSGLTGGWNAGDLAVTNPAALVAVVWLDGGFGTSVPGSGLTELVDVTDGTVGTWGLVYKLAAVAGTTTMSGTFTFTDAGGSQEEWLAAAAAYEAV